MNTYCVKISCGENHKLHFKFNSILEASTITDILSSVVKKNYNLSVKSCYYSKDIDGRTLEWAVDKVKTQRFYEEQITNTTEYQTVLVDCGKPFALPADSITVNQSEYCCFFKPEFTMPLQVNCEELSEITNVRIRPTVNTGWCYMVGHYEINEVSKKDGCTIYQLYRRELTPLVTCHKKIVEL